MVYRTEQDKINRREANQRYYKLEENKQQKRDYMKEYSKRDYVKTKKHEYYVQNKLRWYVEKPKWGGKRKEKTFYPAHEEWAEKNGYRNNDNLHAKNSKKFIDDALNTKNTMGFKDGS